MSKFYSILEEKVNYYKDKIIYVEMPEKIDVSDYQKCLGFTYLEFYNLVNFYIKLLKDNPLNTNIVFVDNSVASNAIIIAMLELNKKPILIDTLSRQILKDIAAPLIYMGNEKNKNMIDYYVENITSNIDTNINGDIIICSSGSEGKPHFNAFKEEELLNIKNQYGEDNSTFYSYISSANISGILTNIVNPLVHNSKAVIRTGFDLAIFEQTSKKEDIIYDEPLIISKRNPELVETLFYGNLDDKILKIKDNKLYIGKILKKYNSIDRRPIYKKLDLKIGNLKELGVQIDEMMLPRDINLYLDNYDCSTIDLSNLKHIYLAGGVNREVTIKKLRENIPSIKDNVLTNLYGSTEAGGVICSCDENNLNPCYIDASNSLNHEIIYTFDKENIFSIKNGKVNKIDISFNEKNFIRFLPVSNSKISNVSIKDDFTIVFYDITGRNKIESTDIGVFINDQLYVVGRKSLLIEINNKSYFLSNIEEYLTKKLDVDTYCILTNDNKIALFINCRDNDLNYKLNIYDKALKLTNQFTDLNFCYPVLLDSKSFPKIEISGKISRAQFEKYQSFAGRQHFNFKLREHSKKEIFFRIINEYLSDYIVKQLNSEYTISVNIKDQYFFDFISISTFFDILSINDEKGEMILRFNDNYMFDISSINLLFEYPKLARLKAKRFLLGQLIVDGIDCNTAKTLSNCNQIFDAYKEISPDMTNEELLKQLRLNVAISMYYSLPSYIRPFFLKGVLKTCEEMIGENSGAYYRAQEILEMIKNYISAESLEDISHTLKKYVENVTYAPSADF